jgi:hypothetical protein
MTNLVKERPILFKGDMVRAILSGQKTMTRRVMKPQFSTESLPEEIPATSSEGWQVGGHSGLWWDGDWPNEGVKCPYGKPGDHLWVRETFRCNGWATDVATIFYRASERNSYTEMCEQFPVDGKKPLPVDSKWRPSIFMPRWASRITLEITDIRVERLQDISEIDAKSEGVSINCSKQNHWSCDDHSGEWIRYPFSYDNEPAYSAKESFQSLWKSINGAGSWDANPWVWVIEFKRIDTIGEQYD